MTYHSASLAEVAATTGDAVMRSSGNGHGSFPGSRITEPFSVSERSGALRATGEDSFAGSAVFWSASGSFTWRRNHSTIKKQRVMAPNTTAWITSFSHHGVPGGKL